MKGFCTITTDFGTGIPFAASRALDFAMLSPELSASGSIRMASFGTPCFSASRAKMTA